MKKTLFALPCMAAIALAAFVGMRTLERNKNINETLLMANVEALTSEEDVNYRYPERSGKALFCKLYVYMSGGVVVSSGTEENPQYEGKIEYEKIIREGLKDRCPDKGNGYNPYFGQVIPY